MVPVATSAGSPHLTVRQEWLAQVHEPALEPELAIVDAHHHLWDRPAGRYLMEDYLADINASGHAVVASIYAQCRTMFDLSRPPASQSVGEVEFANGVAACSASGQYGHPRINAGIIAGADLCLGAAVAPVLEEMRERAGNRLCGVRNTTAWHADARVVSNPSPPPAGILSSAEFRQGVAVLRQHDLTLDVWGYHTQLPEVIALAQAFPDLAIVVDHMGGPLGIGPYAGQREQVFEHWSALVAQLAKLPNVRMKLGGLGMRVAGFDLHRQPLPPTSAQLAALWAPYVMHCIEVFGAERCMFESNFPVDKGMYGYGVLWNAFKRITRELSCAQRTALFSGVATQTYGLALQTTASGPMGQPGIG